MMAPQEAPGGGGRRKRRAPAAHEPPTDAEMEEQLAAHATVAHNEFVSAYSRRTSEVIARNRALNERYLATQRRVRREYPALASPEFLNAMQDISTAQTSELPVEDGGLQLPRDLKATVQMANGGAAQTIRRRAVTLPELRPTPHLTMWTALSKNYSVDDEPQLKFLPYFGDDDDDDVVSEFYQIKLQGTSACEVDFTKEMCERVLETLQGTWDLQTTDLKRVAHAIEVEEEVVIEVYKKLRQAQRAAKKRRKMTAANAAKPNRHQDTDDVTSAGSFEEQYEKAADSFRSLFCRTCYVYDCDYHGCVEVPKLEIAEQNAMAMQMEDRDQIVNTGRNCGNQCFLGQTVGTPKANGSGAASDWDKITRVACARAFFICWGNICEVAKLLGNKTCAEVAAYCASSGITTNSVLRIRLPKRPPPRKKKRIPHMSIAHLRIPENGNVDAIQTKIKSCAHAGPCMDNNCSCIEEGIFCSKHCSCVHDDCKILFRGCRCERGRCRTKLCPCYAAGRECDLDLCTVCCADEIASLKASDFPVSGPKGIRLRRQSYGTNGYEDDTASIMSGSSERSKSDKKDAGWGLFTGEAIGKDEFIIEYIGEMVTQEEAERRGAIYDKVNRSYLFNLDTKTVVDSTRKGNKTRFINHSKRPNCYCKIINVNSDYRIGLFALRDIEAHTELFFDYRYDKEMHHADLLKSPTVTPWLKSRPKAGGRGK